MKKYPVLSRFTLAFAAAAALSAAPVFAQDDKPKHDGPRPQGPDHERPHHDPAKHLEKMKADLGLSEDQVSKLKPVFEADAQKLKQLHDDSSLTPEAKKAKRKEIMEASRSKVDAILTPEQKQKLEEHRKARHGEGRGPGGEGHGPKGEGRGPKGGKPDPAGAGQ